MKAKIILSAGISIVVLVAVFLLVRQDDSEGQAEKPLPAHGGSPETAGHPAPVSPFPAATPMETNQAVCKPSSIEMGEGGTPVVEIDHGLRKIDWQTGEKYPPAIIEAQEKGAVGSVTFRVVDDIGQPVPEATVRGAFWNHGKKGYDFEKTTDGNGLVALQNTCVGDLNFTIVKDGHYETRLRYWFFKAWFDCVENGRWLPWNPTIEIVLKRRVSPVAMHVARSPSEWDITVPALDMPIGFDFEKGDWLPPFGNGIRDDIQIKREFTQQGKEYLDLKAVLTLSFTNGLCGIYEMEKNRANRLQSSYCADTNGVFVKERVFTYDRAGDKIFENSFLTEDKYLVFRTRTKTDKDGKLASAHYGKIYGRIDVNRKGGLVLQYYFNPNENDPNLEADTTKNLLNPRDLGFAP
jgi:hypothetical protein